MCLILELILPLVLIYAEYATKLQSEGSTMPAGLGVNNLPIVAARTRVRARARHVRHVRHTAP
eukprot:1789614-Prymnesium_polylepis.1